MTFPDHGIIETLKGVIARNPGGITISGIAKKTHLNRNLIAKYLDYLLLSGQMEMKQFGSAKIYTLSKRVPLSTLMEYSSDLVLMLDRDLRVQRINEKMIAEFMHDTRKIIGKCIHDSDEVFLQDLSKNLRRHNLNAGISATEFVTYRNGEKRHFLARLIPVIYEDGSPGTALILHDNTEKQEHAEAIAQYSQNRAFLHKKAGEFGDLPAGSDIWAAIGTGIKELYPGTVFLVNSYDPQTFIFTIRCFHGRKERDYLSQLIGRDIVGLVVDAPEGYDRRRSYGDIAQGKLVKIPGNLHVAAFGKIPKDAVDTFNKTFNIGDLYTVGLAVRGVPLGNIILFTRKGDTIKHIDVLEIYARLAALALSSPTVDKKPL